MSLSLSYNPQAYLPRRFISLAWEGVKTEPTKKHNANLCEKLGDGLLWIPENTPRAIKAICTNPQAITISVFAVAHLANSYLFYPQATTETLEFIASYVPEITSEAVRFGLWLSTSELITGCCLRAGGRLTDQYIKSLTQRA